MEKVIWPEWSVYVFYVVRKTRTVGPGAAPKIGVIVLATVAVSLAADRVGAITRRRSHCALFRH
ncbi:hypothetical protein BN2475_520030 [Paraburkholderia ribeironis]|uniref:Uncharacterized protein n=1 Tax=Paraburkholderia ribeironis TaxID=1247936 RepID=A0A1N7SCH3_9BURK|nr:hypothetical protein BN2475_520030 [Paraburkholderia ribeironis]